MTMPPSATGLEAGNCLLGQFFIVFNGEYSSMVGSPGIIVPFSYHMCPHMPEPKKQFPASKPVAEGGIVISPCPATSKGIKRTLATNTMTIVSRYFRARIPIKYFEPLQTRRLQP